MAWGDKSWRSWLGLDSKGAAEPAPPEELDIPLFPLGTVLFPGGHLPLKIFEQRYLDMAAASLRENQPFGICLIARGGEVGAPAEPHGVGTLATLVDCDIPQLGIMMVTAKGGRRFRILERRAEKNGLLRARVELLPEPEGEPVSPDRAALIPVLQGIVSDLGETRVPSPHHFDDAAWVGYRFTEVLPVQPLAKQKLLELEDADMRLEILERYLRDKGILN